MPFMHVRALHPCRNPPLRTGNAARSQSFRTPQELPRRGHLARRLGIIAAAASAAARATSGSTDVYTSRVRVLLECPSFSCTILTSTPAASA
jgi:hypothetical protein